MTLQDRGIVMKNIFSSKDSQNGPRKTKSKTQRPEFQSQNSYCLAKLRDFIILLQETFV